MRQIPFGRPQIDEDERTAVLEVLDSPILVHGPRVEDFERAFAAWTGAPEAVAVSSCTAAMHLIWFTLGIGPGDEVIVPAQTHTATAHAVELTGATPVFVDAEPVTGNVDVAAVEAAITPRTVGIAIVHFLGEPADMGALVPLVRRHSLFLLEDCALAIGTRLDGTHAGLHGDAGCFSFYPVKHMTTAEGGMTITRDAELAAKLRHRRAFGVDRHQGERTVPGVYDVTALGLNYRMNELQSAIGSAQVAKLDGFLAQRRANFEALASGLRGVEGLTVLQASGGSAAQSSYYCLSAVLPAEEAELRLPLVERLRAAGVGTSVYYPRPVPLMTYYRDKYPGGSWPVASWISDCSVALPVGPHLDQDDAAYIAEELGRALKEVRG